MIFRKFTHLGIKKKELQDLSSKFWLMERKTSSSSQHGQKEHIQLKFWLFLSFVVSSIIITHLQDFLPKTKLISFQKRPYG
jgi:hypothetical protein